MAFSYARLSDPIEPVSQSTFDSHLTDSQTERPAPLSVSAAMSLAKGALEGVTVRLLGEVSELSNKPGYKAVYFTVKDQQSALPCMMWNSRYSAAGVPLRVGMMVELTGRFTLYAAKGRMNFDVFSLVPAGEGMLRLQVANLAKKLQAEGLMDPARKRAIPWCPERIGLVTSPRGAAVHDVLRTLKRRFPLARVVLAGVPVEGQNAPAGLIEGLRSVCSAGVEVVLVVRGGGSFEDLMPFNDEGLARAIAACPVPVVTGIGHEPDTCIADMVADARSSTPTAAAEAVSPSRESLEDVFRLRARSMVGSMSRIMERCSAQVAWVSQRPVLRDPNVLFAGDALSIDYMAERLSRVLPSGISRDFDRVRVARDRLARALPLATTREAACLENLRQRVSASSSFLSLYGSQLSLAAARLHDLSPLGVLARGYAVTRTQDGALVKSVREVTRGSRVVVSVSDGDLFCRVEDVQSVGVTVDV